MKLKHIFSALVAATLSLGFTACNDGDYEETHLSEVQLSQSYIAIPVDGGSTSITVNAKDSWAIDTTGTSGWLTVSPVSGSAGQATVSFSAESTIDGRSATLPLSCGGKTQYIEIIQGVSTISSATCAEVIAGPNSKTYQVTGTVTAIANTTYGNFYIEDGTGSIYIYGTKINGAYPNGNLPFEVGDEVTVTGPKTTYGTTIELVDVEINNVNKSLIKCDSVSVTEIPLEGGEAEFFLTCKGQGVTVDIPEDAKGWLSISSIQSSSNAAVVTFKAAANTGGDRSTTITFHTTDGSKDYTAQAELLQKGAIIECSIADFNGSEVGDTQYRLTGVISEIARADRGRFYISDYSGTTYVYNMAGFADLGLKVGDVVTLVGKHDRYQTTEELVSATLENSISCNELTIAQALQAADNTLCLVTGKIQSIANETYGNMYLEAEDGSVIYLYGLYPGYGATGDARKGTVAAKGLKVGDTVTVLATKTTYKDAAQLQNGAYISHTSAE